jgi:hypothetical protein
LPSLFEKNSFATPVPAPDAEYHHCVLALLLVESPTQYRVLAANDSEDPRDTFQTLAVPLRLAVVTVPIVARRLPGEGGLVLVSLL